MKGAIGSMELLLESLRSLQARLKRDGEVHFLTARPTLQEFQRQKLPEHIQVGTKQFVGSRSLKRASHHVNIPRVIHAHWREDHLVENTVPAMSCIVRGAADMRIAGYVVYCQPGDFLFHPPYVPSADGSLAHFEGEPKNRRCDILMIFPGTLLGKGIECAMCHSVGEQHVNGTHIWIKSLLLAQLFQSIYEETARDDNSQSVYHLISTLLFFLERDIEEKRGTPPPFKPSYEIDVKPASEPVHQARKFMETHLASSLTIREVARLVCISPTMLSQRFRKETGQTFHQCLTSLRLKQAALLLTETDYKVNDISALVGLTDSQLRILTRQHWGCTPKEYRNRKKMDA